MTSRLPDPHYQSVFYDGIPAKRLFAWLIDVVITTLIALILGLMLLTIPLFIWPVWYLVLSFLYRSATIAGGSATIGMRVMNIQLRGATGAKLSGTEAAVHTLAYLTCSAFALPQLLSLVLMVTGNRHQGLHDMLIGSAAINRPR
ncbi:RDD family protein [Rhodophyticola sp. CCM32]|uniref:RDD family protein n=1 Tax=Rhodophyticola sp. CCM32 TaxID=2916397 RepID=UPI00143CE7B7|nr:RDD family protein [Rhodophyticola sp. CCM32]